MADLDSSFYGKSGSELSVGQQQRVALARMLANDPEVLLLDEPTSVLDPISTQNVEDVLIKLKEERGMTVVMVSHSVKQIQRALHLPTILLLWLLNSLKLNVRLGLMNSTPNLPRYWRNMRGLRKGVNSWTS
ncbi:ABC transporter I family member 17 [Linum grandiflorum]